MAFSGGCKLSSGAENIQLRLKHEDLFLGAFLVTFMFYTLIEVAIALYYCLRYGMYKFLSYHINVRLDLISFSYLEEDLTHLLMVIGSYNTVETGHQLVLSELNHIVL